MMGIVRKVMIIAVLLNSSIAYGAFKPMLLMRKPQQVKPTPGLDYFAELIGLGAELAKQQQPVRDALARLRVGLQAVADNVRVLQGKLDTMKEKGYR